jgi:hypothetical protein
MVTVQKFTFFYCHKNHFNRFEKILNTSLAQSNLKYTKISEVVSHNSEKRSSEVRVFRVFHAQIGKLAPIHAKNAKNANFRGPFLKIMRDNF